MFPASLLCKIPRGLRQRLRCGELGSHEAGQTQHSRTLSRIAR